MSKPKGVVFLCIFDPSAEFAARWMQISALFEQDVMGF
jgi:hypothetical protein